MGSRGHATRARGAAAAIALALAVALALGACGAGTPIARTAHGAAASGREAAPAVPAGVPRLVEHPAQLITPPQPARAGALLHRGPRAGTAGTAGDDDREIFAPGRGTWRGVRAGVAGRFRPPELELRTRPINRHVYGRAPPTDTPHEE